MNISIIKKDLFEIDNKKYALAHCISEDCKMGAGIAKEFNKRFPNMKNEIINTIISNNLSYPITLPYYIYEDSNINEGVIFNLITKKNYWNKPTMNTITTCIEEMAYMCKEYKIKHLAMPLIGCGLDRLKWCEVEKIVKEKFMDLNIEILICIKEM